MKFRVKPSSIDSTALTLDLPAPDRAESATPASQTADRLDRTDRPSRPRRSSWWFVIGVLLGWIVIGWWLWPVEWTDAGPWRLSPQHQRIYVSLVADEYSQSANVATATHALTGWNRHDLSNLLATMQRETSDPLTQQHLANLIAVLELPGSEATLSATLAGQPGILLALAVSAMPLLAALALVIVNVARRQKTADDDLLLQYGQRAIGEESVAGEAAELSDEAAAQEWQRQSDHADQRAETEQSQAAAESTAGGQQSDGQTQPQPAQPAKPAADQPGDQAEPAKAAARPGQPPKAEENKPVEQSNGQAEPAKSELSSVLKLFEEEEDTSLSELGALAKDLIEVNVDELLDLGTQMLRRFHRGKRTDEAVVELAA